jgi:hypothetical protein
MTAAYFEEHPTDPDKVIMRKPHHPIKSDKERTWVGLTDDDWKGLAYDTEFFAGAAWAEAKLKEKNT